MGRTISLCSATSIEPEEFLHFVGETGGQIFDKEDIDGSVSSGGCHVWFYGVRGALAGDFEESEEDVIAALGAPVRARVDLHLSHHGGSGALALRLAHGFAKRWSAVATVAVYRFFTAMDIAHLLNGARVPEILSASIDIMSVAAPESGATISVLGGITIDPNDPAWVDSAQVAVAAIDGASYDPGSEQVLGAIPSGDAYLWVLRRALAQTGKGSNTDLDEKLVSIATRRLGARPLWGIRVLIGYGATRESERIALIFADKLLQAVPGVVVGIFECVLGAEELGEMLESGDDIIVA